MDGTGARPVLKSLLLMEVLKEVNKGNILDHEYEIGEGRDKVAEVSKKWFRLRDSYGVAIEPGQDDVLILPVAVFIDEMAHQGR